MRTTVGVALIILAIALSLYTGCRQPAEQAEEVVPPPVTEVPDEPAAAPAPDSEAQPAPTTEATPEDETMVKISTNKGDIIAELWLQEAPVTAGNFLLLAEGGFYDGLTFHRVVPTFVIQGGDPNGNGTGGPGFSIPLEIAPGKRHGRGVLSMARSADPNSAGSQFFICLSEDPSVKNLDGGYAVFGEVTAGMDVVDQIAVGDQITAVTVTATSPDAEAARKAADEARVKQAP